MYANYNWSLRDRRKIAATTILNYYNYPKVNKELYIRKLLDKKVNLIIYHYSNYIKYKRVKLQNSFKKLYFNRPFVNMILADDLIKIIFNVKI
jgi:hypothetical protein